MGEQVVPQIVAGVALSLLVLGCGREAKVVVRADPTPQDAAPAPVVPPKPAPEHRTHGDLTGKFTLAADKVVVGEPIVVTLELTAQKAPMTIFVGGDMRNAANYPLRFSVRATDSSGAEVCDLVAKPPFPSFGGPGSDRTLAKGETMRESFVVNPACPALGTAGSYRITVHRRVTTMGMVMKKPGATVPTSCDVVPIHEDPLPAWIDPLCAKQLTDAPSVTSVLPIEIAPFDAKRVRTGIEARLKEIDGATPRDEILRHRLERHVCGVLSCACPKPPPVSNADLLSSVPAALPGSFPGFCP